MKVYVLVITGNSLVLSFGLALSKEKFHVYLRMSILSIAMLNYAMKGEMIDHFVVVREAVYIVSCGVFQNMFSHF